jgi:hypothetical protein
MTTNGDKLVISPIRPGGKQAKLNRALGNINKKFGSALKKLAE